MAVVIVQLRVAGDAEKNDQLKAAAKRGEKKMIEYYCKSAYSKPVVMATVCDPRYRFDYFNWAKQNGITEHDVDIQKKAYATAYEEFTKYFLKRTGNKEPTTRKVSNYEESG
jgi:hypothetical protein